MLLQLTASVDNQLPSFATNGNGGNICDIFVGHGAGAGEAVAVRLAAVDLLNPFVALGDEVLH